VETWTTYAGILRWIERWWISDAIRTVPYLYPVLESLHIAGIAALVGSAFAVDLRLFGVARNAVPVTIVTRYLLPISHAGFAVVAFTGLAMFIAVAWKVGTSAAISWKLALIAVAGVNILVFHLGAYQSVAQWDIGRPPPLAARTAALVSAATWVGVIVAGRFIAY
jgi:hypothetical protein